MVLLGACAGRSTGPIGPLPLTLDAALDSLLSATPLQRTHWGIHVVDAGSGEVIYSRNAGKHFITASNMKLVTGTAALALLGPDFRYRTQLLVTPLAGDSVAQLIVVGSGDPTWSTRFHPSVTSLLDSIARDVRESGIAAAGELIVDAARFTDALVHPTWEVSDLVGTSAPPVDAIALSEGTFRVVLRGGAAPGSAGEVQLIGDDAQPMRAVVITDTAGARRQLDVDYTARNDTIYLFATVGAGAADTVTLAVTRPADVAAAALVNALQRGGVRVHASRVIRDSAASAALRAPAALIGEMMSPPMSQIVAHMLAPSQNWIAEQLAKTMGAEIAGDGSWRGGLDAARTFLSDVAGIDTAAFLLRDASGLSAQNLLTPAATVDLLRFARLQPWGAMFRNGLAQPSLPGTLSSRLAPLAGRVFAKTGTITNVNSLSGYLVTDGGRELIFSIFSNASGLPAATVRNAIDQIVLMVARAR
jgi:D-alanyl-D-alanine carboxypeptidase/D-alanyl-D-alanine-endopeptidase (penicillin-binding protein 4)